MIKTFLSSTNIQFTSSGAFVKSFYYGQKNYFVKLSNRKYCPAQRADIIEEYLVYFYRGQRWRQMKALSSICIQDTFSCIHTRGPARLLLPIFLSQRPFPHQVSKTTWHNICIRKLPAGLDITKGKEMLPKTPRRNRNIWEEDCHITLNIRKK